MEFVFLHMLLIGWAASAADEFIVKLIEPINNTVFALRNNDKTATVLVKYEIVNATTGLTPLLSATLVNTQFCMMLAQSLPESTEMFQMLPLTCFSQDLDGPVTKTLSDVPVGNFQLQLQLRDATTLVPLADTKAVSSFNVKKVSEMLPAIMVTSLLSGESTQHYSTATTTHRKVIKTAFKPDASMTDVLVEYALGDTLLPPDGLDVCIHLSNATSGLQILKLTCISSTQRSLSLQAMGEGIYLLAMTLAHAQPPHQQVEPQLYESSRVELELVVRPLTHPSVIPAIATATDNIERVLDSATDKKDVAMAFGIVGVPSATALVQVCVQIDSYPLANSSSRVPAGTGPGRGADEETEDKPVKLVSLICIPQHDTQVTVQGMGQGRHLVTFLLRLVDEPFTHLPSTEQTMTIELRLPEEFVPTYRWSLLHAWHTIPASIETRLASALTPLLALACAALHPVRHLLFLPALKPALSRALVFLRRLGDWSYRVEGRVGAWVGAAVAPLAPLARPLAPYGAYARRVVQTPGWGAVAGSWGGGGAAGGVGVEVSNVVCWGTAAHLLVFCVCLLCQLLGPRVLRGWAWVGGRSTALVSCDRPVGGGDGDDGDVGLPMDDDDDDDDDNGNDDHDDHDDDDDDDDDCNDDHDDDDIVDDPAPVPGDDDADA